ncbi:hypothetical protein ACQJBY_069664 [Aegilops geniculata]
MQRWVRGMAALVAQARDGAVAAAVSDALDWRQSGGVTWPRTRAAFRVVERLRTAWVRSCFLSVVHLDPGVYGDKPDLVANLTSCFFKLCSLKSEACICEW